MDTQSTRSSAELEELRGRLQNAMEKLRDVAEPFHRDALLEMLRTIDWAQLYMMSAGEWPPLWVERVRFGMVRALAWFVAGSAKPQAEQSLLGSEEHVVWAGFVLQRCGLL